MDSLIKYCNLESNYTLTLIWFTGHCDGNLSNFLDHQLMTSLLLMQPVKYNVDRMDVRNAAKWQLSLTFCAILKGNVPLICCILICRIWRFQLSGCAAPFLDLSDQGMVPIWAYIWLRLRHLKPSWLLWTFLQLGQTCVGCKQMGLQQSWARVGPEWRVARLGWVEPRQGRTGSGPCLRTGFQLDSYWTWQGEGWVNQDRALENGSMQCCNMYCSSPHALPVLWNLAFSNVLLQFRKKQCQRTSSPIRKFSYTCGCRMVGIHCKDGKAKLVCSFQFIPTAYSFAHKVPSMILIPEEVRDNSIGHRLAEIIEWMWNVFSKHSCIFFKQSWNGKLPIRLIFIYE